MFTPTFSYAELALIMGKVIKRFREEPVKPKDQYRIDWIKAISNKIIDLLEKESLVFNQTNPKEKLTERELFAILEFTIKRIQEAFKNIKST